MTYSMELRQLDVWGDAVWVVGVEDVAFLCFLDHGGVQDTLDLFDLKVDSVAAKFSFLSELSFLHL